MTPEVQPERPKPVTAIGWIWLVLGGVFFLRCLLDLIAWKLVQPATPTIVAFALERSPQTAFLRPLLEHFTAIRVIEAVASLCVAVAAYQMLRLRPWARIVVEGACWVVLTYVVCFAVFWVAVWGTQAPVPVPTRETFALLAGLAVCVAMAASLAIMIRLLRSGAVRAAFRHPRPDAAAL